MVDSVGDAIREVRAVYADLEARPIERNCVALTQCCRFHLTGRTPRLTKGEALVAAKAVRATGRTTLAEQGDGACPLLDEAIGECRIYQGRPFGCRTHFCASAGGPYPRRDVIDLIRRLEEVDAALGGDGPRGIQSAVADALGELKRGRRAGNRR